MNRCDIMELHFIAPIANVPSIIKHGILLLGVAPRYLSGNQDVS